MPRFDQLDRARLFLSACSIEHLKEGLIDDERGPCGGAGASRGECTVSEDEEGPSKSNSIDLEFRQGTQGCDKVNRLRLGN